LIGRIQPLRVAAIFRRQRAWPKEYGCTLGEQVGYSIRIDDMSSKNSFSFRYATDGMLLRARTRSSTMT
jgi:HrpA-like RNA helicase